MHVDLTTTSQSLAGTAANRTLCMITADPKTVVHVFAADTTGVSGIANGAFLFELTAQAPKIEILDGSTYLFYVLKQGTAPTAIWVDAPVVAITAAATLAGFGDGSDGSVVFDGVTTVLGIAPVASAYTLTRDIFLLNGQLNAGITLNTAGFKIFCAGLWSDAATSVIANNGGAGGTGAAGVAGAAGTAGATGSTGGGTAGGAGGAGSAVGAAGTANAIGFPGGTGAGGAGGTDGTNGGGAAGAWAALAASKGGARHFTALVSCGTFGSAGFNPIGGGSGGGGGGGNNADAGGGGGGGGGGVAFIAAFNFVHNGAMTASGGAGGTGFSTAHNAGGGGGGGGGYACAVYRTISGTGTISAAGGAGGAKAATGVVGSAGTAGVTESVAV